MIAALYARLQYWLALAGVLALALLYAFTKGKTSGRASMQEGIRKQNEKLSEKFRKIDSKPADLDGALGRLRDRSRKG